VNFFSLFSSHELDFFLVKFISTAIHSLPAGFFFVFEAPIYVGDHNLSDEKENAIEYQSNPVNCLQNFSLKIKE
jgi:hypothetical protein